MMIIFASAGLQQKRKETCSSCPHLLVGNICGACGCVLKLKYKFAHAKCPEDKWPNVTLPVPLTNVQSPTPGQE